MESELYSLVNKYAFIRKLIESEVHSYPRKTDKITHLIYSGLDRCKRHKFFQFRDGEVANSNVSHELSFHQPFHLSPHSFHIKR